ncbi:hypothetical protein EON64_19750, partial [archaeon]
MMRNPNAMQQMMRSQDLAMSQLENIPGGFNALRRMYEEVQEPMMEAQLQGQGGAGSTNTTNTSTSTSTPPSTAPTSAAVPNPWQQTTAPANPFLNAGVNPFAMGAMGGMG